jgi:hypothetical protein
MSSFLSKLALAIPLIAFAPVVHAAEFWSDSKSCVNADLEGVTTTRYEAIHKQGVHGVVKIGEKHEGKWGPLALVARDLVECFAAEFANRPRHASMTSSSVFPQKSSSGIEGCEANPAGDRPSSLAFQVPSVSSEQVATNFPSDVSNSIFTRRS